MYCLDSLNLVGNPVCNMHPDLASIKQDESAVQAALGKYFGSSQSSGIPALGGTGNSGFVE